MLFRAVFWIGLVSVLMPREPDIGYGRPGTDSISTLILSAAEKGISAEPRIERSTLTDGLQALALRSLAQIKADIEESQALREHFGS